jgi:hypothetical protein
MADSYRIEYAYFIDSKNPEYQAPWNQITNVARLYTPADTAVPRVSPENLNPSRRLDRDGE